MDHVQQILLQQLQGGGNLSQTSRNSSQRNSSHDSSNSDGSNSVSELAVKARQWAEEQKRKQLHQEHFQKNQHQQQHHHKKLQKQQPQQQQNLEQQGGSLQGWKNEHPSWFPGTPSPVGHNFSSQIRPQAMPFSPQQAQMKFFQTHHQTHSKKNRKNRINNQRQNAQKKLVGRFPDFDETETSKNLPKWMRDEISRIQHKKTDEMPEAPDESNISELQKLVDEDSDGESSEDDWKVEGRKLSEDLAKGASSIFFRRKFIKMTRIR